MLLACLRALLLCALLLASPLLRAADPLTPEDAFRTSVHVVDPANLEVEFRIAPGYYLYRHRFSFASADPALKLGEAQLPAGAPHDDEFFGRVETYRDVLRIRIPVSPAKASSARLVVGFQGCADAGVCYPPQSRELDAGEAGGGVIARALGRLGGAQAPAEISLAPEAATSAARASMAPTAQDESSRLATLLAQGSLWVVLLTFFGAGLLLAFTPCMLPMLPVLASIVVGREQVGRGRALLLAGAYVLGMALTYAVAGVAAGLSGTLLASALQNVWVLSAFALLFVLLAGAMFGFYELQLPAGLQQRLSQRASAQQGGHVVGVAVMGALSALIIGPCVAAPLAGALLYIARTGNAVLGGLALFTLAIGMGVPLMLAAGAARELLPRTGPWMERVRSVFGVMLLGVALWLLVPVTPPWLQMLLWGALLVLCGVHLHALEPLPPRARRGQRAWKGLGVLALLFGVAELAGALGGAKDPLQPLSFLRGGEVRAEVGLDFQRVSTVAELEARLAEGRPVMLDFYADWCVSCREMERFTFQDARVRQALKGTMLLRADVTANGAEDKALLKRFELFGPPGIVFFDAGGHELQDLRVIGYQDAERFLATLQARH